MLFLSSADIDVFLQEDKEAEEEEEQQQDAIVHVAQVFSPWNYISQYLLFLASADIDVFLQEDKERGEDQDQQQREGSGALSRESAPEEE